MLREQPLSAIVHPWLRTLRVAFVPGPERTPLLERFGVRWLDTFRALGHHVLEQPRGHVDCLFTTAPFGRPLNWRKALLFTARRRWGLENTPTILTLVHARPDEFRAMLDHFERALQRTPPDPADFTFEGLAPTAYQTLIEQGLRGGPILALERLVQAQAKSIRVLLVVGEEEPQYAYLFDLVGAHPRVSAHLGDGFYRDLALRVVTALSTQEVTQHQVVGEPIPRQVWETLTTPQAMRRAAQELGRRDFFTRMVRIADLVHVPAVDEAVASQYSEGCFATWDPQISALIATITGSARPVDKDNITENELAVIVGVRPDGRGARVRHVEGKRNDPPSSEAVEMMAMDEPLPRIHLTLPGPDSASTSVEVPVARSKLHGHRGIQVYDPRWVEFVPLDPPYYHYPVSCATEAQARGIRDAFARSQALQDPEDPRKVIFTVLPGHGLVMVEKWDPDKVPFQLFWEYMDTGILQIDPRVPQGPFTYEPGDDGLHHLRLLE